MLELRAKARSVGAYRLVGVREALELDLQGNGLFGAILAPLARSRARKQLPEDQRRLKERLESEHGLPAA